MNVLLALAEVIQPDGTLVEEPCDVNDVGGIMTCSCPASAWCAHLQQAVAKNLDRTSMLAGMPEDVDDPNFAVVHTVRVPLVPTEDLYVNVACTGLHRSGMVGVSMNLDHQKRTIDLGIIMRGQEGRNSIRLMLSTWLQAEMSMAEPRCTNSTHKRLEWSRAWKRPASWGPRDMAQAWSIVTTGACTECIPYMTFDLDIPEMP